MTHDPITPRGTTRLTDQYPGWLHDIDATLPVTASYIVHGNIHDRYLIPTPAGLAPLDLTGSLWATLQASGFEALIVHTPLGQRVHPPSALDVASTAAGMSVADLTAPAGPERLGSIIAAILGNSEHRVALAIDYVSQRGVQGQLSDTEHTMLAATLARLNGCHPRTIGSNRQAPLYNAVFWLVEQPADLPPWFVGGSDVIRQISIPQPDLTARAQLARILIAASGSSPGVHDDHAATRFAETTEGLTLKNLISIWRLAADRGLSRTDIADAVRTYRTGLLKNPWAQSEVRERLRTGVAALSRRVRGQDRATRQALDILIRSNLGMSGAERGGATTGPRGILFFAGPTGVGKTELAKAMTELIFGDERAYIRFDMSEFSSEHSEARLIGSPPGYVGHGQGGELTNAVRQRPFCLVLFDEIEKAHPRILDKFLQILSDGRLTDGSGATVHFGEAIVVFTSNLGVPPLDPAAPVPRGSELESLVKASIDIAFTEDLQRPELLGRIGEDNIVVFDYIDPTTAAELADIFIANVTTHVRERLGIPLVVDPAVRDQVVDLATRDLRLGGRGISRVIESVFVNPLSRALFEHGEPPPTSVAGITYAEGGWWTLTLR